MRLRVRIGQERSPAAAIAGALDGSVLCVCGGVAALGSWDPKKSPQLQRVENGVGGTTLWEGTLSSDIAVPGTEFKYCLLNLAMHEYAWETQCIRAFPEAGAEVFTHEFDTADHSPGVVVGAAGRLQPAPPVRVAAASRGKSSVPSAMQVKRRLVVKFESASVVGSGAVVVCGASHELGGWRPEKALRMQPLHESAGCAWEAEVSTKQGAAFKYVVLAPSKGALWEERRRDRHFGAGPEAAVHSFDSLEAFEEENTAGEDPKGPVVSDASTVFTAAEVVELGDCIEHWLHWGGSQRRAEATLAGACCAPRSIFHAFHWQFTEVRRRLKEIRDLGFSAVQLSPAQKSKDGSQWWTRYQPQEYTRIEGLGSLEDLRQLGNHAQELGVTLVADVVFNHMVVVASGHEWKQAQGNPTQLEALQRRLDKAVGPTLGIEDFQWPWFMMSGPHWDNENRYEGWGNGEWSELRHCPNVVKVHQQHLRMLLDAGIRGVRFDAVKHMRPAHIDEYVKFLRETDLGVYIYGEVLSVDASMHSEYMDHPLNLPTSDFPLTVYLHSILSGGIDAATLGAAAATRAAAAADGVFVASGDATSAPMLAADSVRFARNHDTVMNPGSFYGLKSRCKDARIVWVWLLAVHDGVVLMYPEDLFHTESAALLQRALRFRARTACADETEVCLTYSNGGGPPKLLTLALRRAGHLEGLCLINTRPDVQLRLRKVPRNGSSGGAGGGQCPVVTLTPDTGDAVCMQPDGSLADKHGEAQSVVIPPMEAVFFLAGDERG